MSAWRTFLAKLRALLRLGSRDPGFDDEIQAHLALLTERFVRGGMTAEEARYAARRQFGNLLSLREARSEMLTFASLNRIADDLRYGARVFARTPGWTAVALVTLMLGIGANVAIFSLVRPILLEPLPYSDADRIVVPATIFQRDEMTDRGMVSYADIIEWRGQPGLFQAVAGLQGGSADLTADEQPERVNALYCDETYFDVMGARPLRGRFFKPDENLPNAPPVAVLSYGLWMRRFGGDPAAIGARIEIRGVPATILGVAAQDATWPAEAEIFLPLGTGGQPSADMLRRDNHEYMALARLAPDVSFEQAQAKLTAIGARVAREETNRAGTNYKLHSLATYIVGPTLRQMLIVLFGAVVCVLLIACVNVTNLLLARGAAREREVAIRAALGAGWGRIAAQSLAESALLALCGGLAGVVAGYWGLQALVRLAPADIPRLDEAQIDAPVLAFTAGLCVLTTILAGLAPAWRAARVAPGQTFHEGSRTATGGLRTGRLRGLLVISELALSIVLLTTAGLLIRSFALIQRIDPGIVTKNVVTFETSVPRVRYAEAPQIAVAFERLTAAVRRVPDVTAASATSALPLGGGGFYLGRVFLREGQPEPPASTDTPAAWLVIQPTYFETLRIPILQGRAFTPQDSASSTPVIIISQAMAREMFPNQNPLGRRIRSWRDENLYREIVGIVGDVRHYGLTDRQAHNVYVPHAQNTWRSLVVVVRTARDPNLLLGSIRGAIWSVDRKLPVANVQTLDAVRDRNLAQPRFTMFLLSLFGATAVVLAAVGIYGMIAYAVAQRSREIGIRMALGAVRSRVIGMVAWNALRLALAGVVSGLMAAIGLGRLVRSLLFQVSPTDPWTFAAAPLLLFLITMVAACIPARRASRVDPVATLRSE